MSEFWYLPMKTLLDFLFYFFVFNELYIIPKLWNDFYDLSSWEILTRIFWGKYRYREENQCQRGVSGLRECRNDLSIWRWVSETFWAILRVLISIEKERTCLMRSIWETVKVMNWGSELQKIDECKEWRLNETSKQHQDNR